MESNSKVHKLKFICDEKKLLDRLNSNEISIYSTKMITNRMVDVLEELRPFLNLFKDDIFLGSKDNILSENVKRKLKPITREDARKLYSIAVMLEGIMNLVPLKKDASEEVKHETFSKLYSAIDMLTRDFEIPRGRVRTIDYDVDACRMNFDINMFF
jgi:hypothetical protein